VELATAVLSAITLWRLGPGAAGAWGLLALWGLIALTIIDLDHQILPDNIVLPGLWFGLTLNTVEIFTDLTSAVIGAVAGYLLLWLFYQAFRLITGKEGMGYGDFKLFRCHRRLAGLAAVAAGTYPLSAGGIGCRYSSHPVARPRPRIPIPFGPFLAVAGWVAMLWGEILTSAICATRVCKALCCASADGRHRQRQVRGRRRVSAARRATSLTPTKSRTN
jgi:leader peptidase (prepilin peptidase)/N-methyltransferase